MKQNYQKYQTKVTKMSKKHYQQHKLKYQRGTKKKLKI